MSRGGTCSTVAASRPTDAQDWRIAVLPVRGVSLPFPPRTGLSLSAPTGKAAPEANRERP